MTSKPISKPIFIHIPKTGGTSINCMMHGTTWQTTPDYHYRHIIYETKASNCGDIFQPENISKYNREFIFSMLRHPVDRLISEYYFLRKHDEFMSLLIREPRNFEDFIGMPETCNYMLRFLDGGNIYSTKLIPEERAMEIIQLIDELDIHFGIFEEFDRSLSYLSDVGQFDWPAQIEIKRATLNRPKVSDLDDKLIKRILEHNKLDMLLYQHCFDKLIQRTKSLELTKYKYVGGKYEHIIPYTTRFCILEIALSNKQFIIENKSFLATLNIYLHKTETSGKAYAKNWAKHFKKSVVRYYPNTVFSRKIKRTKKLSPLDEIVAIAGIIDEASKDHTMGLELGKPRMQLPMSPQMISVFEKAGLIGRRNSIK